MNAEMDKLFTPEEVADILKVRPTTVKGWLRDGVLNGFKINSHMWRVKPEELRRFIDNKVKGA